MDSDTDNHDPVHSPSHYGGEIECIDAMRAAFTPAEVAAFCKLNTFKYLWRAGKKNMTVEDLEKAIVYLGWNIEAEKEQIENPVPEDGTLDFLDDLLDEAWGVIANANTDDWNTRQGDPESDWLVAAKRWREKYHAYLHAYLRTLASASVGLLHEEAQDSPQPLARGGIVSSADAADINDRIDAITGPSYAHP